MAARPASTTVSDDDGGHAAAPTVQARRPVGLGYVVLLIMLLAAFAFYLSFAIPEFMGIVSGPPLAAG